MNNATRAIDRSISHHEIVTIDATSDDISTLLAECEGSADAGLVEEYWGTRAGNEWRVHVTNY